MIVGGPSILAILETVFVDHQLVPALQWIMDGYNRLMAVLSAVAEPLIQSAIEWLAAQLNWHLSLAPVWRPLFALGMVVVLGDSRTRLRDGRLGHAITNGICLGSGLFVGAAMAGVAPSSGGWWAQGLRAAAPVFCVMAMASLVDIASDVARGDREHLSKEIVELTLGAPLVGSGVFAMAAALYFIPGWAGSAGVIVLGVVVVLLGAFFLARGLIRNGNRFDTRFGLTVLGGFFAAGLILAADFGLKVLGAVSP